MSENMIKLPTTGETARLDDADVEVTTAVRSCNP